MNTRIHPYRPPLRTNRLCLIVLGVALSAVNPTWVNSSIAGETVPETVEIESAVVELEDSEQRGAVSSDEEESPNPIETGGTTSELKLSGRKLRAKQRQVQAVVLLFMAVVFLGIGMLVVILLYGSWIRRLNRKRSQVPSLAEELARLKASSREGESPAPNGVEGQSSSIVKK